MLGGGLLPGTLAVAYGATGVGKTHLGLTFAHQGRKADGRPGLVVDMNGRGDSQQHAPYASRLFGWEVRRWTHTVMPMASPQPAADQLEALVARKVGAGDIGAVANTVLLMGRDKIGNRIGRFLCVAKHRGSAATDEIVEYGVDERGLRLE